MPQITKGSFSDATLLKYFLRIPSNKNTYLLRHGNCNIGPCYISPNRRALVYLGAEETHSVAHGLYQFCLLFPFPSSQKKIESRLIKIKWSELSSYFPLHLWSICFQIYSAGSIFSPPGLTLVQFKPTALPKVQKQATLARR